MEARPILRPGQKRHSIFGSISLVVGLLSMLLACGGLVVIIALVAIHQGQVDTSSFDMAVSGLCAIASGPLGLIGLGSGVAGFFERDRDHVPNILGIILAIISLLVLAGMLLFGLVGRSQPTLQPNL